MSLENSKLQMDQMDQDAARSARPQLREDGRSGGAAGAPLGTTTKITDKFPPSGPENFQENQKVKEVTDPNTGELVRYEYCHRRCEWVAEWDTDAAKLERWLLLGYAKRFLGRPDYWETRSKSSLIPYCDLTASIPFCDLETREVCKVPAHLAGLPVIRHKRFYPQAGERYNRAPKFRVVRCFHDRVPGKHAELYQNAVTGSTTWHNVGVCGSVWLCPICSMKINYYRRSEIAKAYDAVAEAGGRAYMFTFTVRHSVSDDLESLISKFKLASQIFQKSYDYKQITRRHPLKRPRPGSLPFLGFIGRISTMEVTFGRNGWHPHEHALWFFDKSLTKRDLKIVHDCLFRAWTKACLAVGLLAPRKFVTCSGKRRAVGLDIREALSASEYLTKFGNFRRWGPEKELAGAHMKTAKSHGATPFQLLYQAAEGCRVSRERFIEFAHAFKGRHQLQFSRTLKKFLSDFDLQIDDSASGDLALASKLDGDSDLLYRLSDYEFDKVVRHSAQGLILHIAKNQGLTGVLEFLNKLPD